MAFLDMGGRKQIDPGGCLCRGDAWRQFHIQVFAMIVPIGAAVVVPVLLVIPGHEELSIIESSVPGQVGVDGADAEYDVVVHLDAFADGVGVTEEAGGEGSRRSLP